MMQQEELARGRMRVWINSGAASRRVAWSELPASSLGDAHSKITPGVRVLFLIGSGAFNLKVETGGSFQWGS
jgi:hypothetical protein